MPNTLKRVTDHQLPILVWLGLSAVFYLLLGYYTPREEFGRFLVLYALAFFAYLQLLKYDFSLRTGLAAAVGLRLVLLFSLPSLSDDYARFLWDGRLLLHGENPFLHLPAHYLSSDAAAVPGLTQDLFSRLNSPHYYSVYPPVLQFIFWLSSLLSPESERGAFVVMRLFLIAAEAGSVLLLGKLLHKMTLPEKRVWLYAFNPLVVLELTGNLHFEAVMIFFILLAVFLLFQEKWSQSAVALGLAISTKLIPLLFLPLLLRRLHWQQFLLYCSLAAAVFLLSFAPFASETLFRNILDSVDLYFQKFEFNASVYYLARYLGFRFSGYNQIALIGPALSVLVLLGVLALALFERHHTIRSLPGSCVAALALYLLLATTVHPWYITTLLALSVLTPFRFPMLWSAVVALSYAAYRTPDYTENLTLVAVEYVLLFLWLGAELLLYRTRLRQNLLHPMHRQQS